MKTIIAPVLGLAITLGSTSAFAQVAPPAPPPPPANVAPPVAAPPVAQGGEWVQSAEYGWIWVPTAADTVVVNNQPYTYFYTPSYGWTWYVSPWGYGRYQRGPWVTHAYYAPRVWRTNVWVAPERRVVVQPRYAPPARVVVRGPVQHAPPARPVIVHHHR